MYLYLFEHIFYESSDYWVLTHENKWTQKEMEELIEKIKADHLIEQINEIGLESLGKEISGTERDFGGVKRKLPSGLFIEDVIQKLVSDYGFKKAEYQAAIDE